MRNSGLFKILVALFVAALAFSVPVVADEDHDHDHHHGDIGLDIDNGSIVVGGLDHDGLNPLIRVFGAEIDQEVLVNYWITSEAKPGYDAIWEDDLTGKNFGIAFVQGLSVWNGAGFDPVSETLRILNPQGPGYSDSNSTIPGFYLPVVTGEEVWHYHPTAALLGVGSNAPADGVYLALLKIVNQEGIYSDSSPYAILYNKGMSEHDHHEAMEWVNENVVPEPSSLLALLAGFGGMGALLRRKAWCRLYKMEM